MPATESTIVQAVAVQDEHCHVAWGEGGTKAWPINVRQLELHILHAALTVIQRKRDSATEEEILELLRQRGIEAPPSLLPLIEGMRAAGWLTGRNTPAAPGKLGTMLGIRVTPKGIERLRRRTVQSTSGTTFTSED